MKISESAIVKVSVCGIFSRPTFKSEMVTQALKSEKVKLVDKKNNWFKVYLVKDGYTGWIHEMYFSDSKILKQTFKPEMFTDFPIINKAFSMLGVPYVWGGRSSNGYDCSGLIQTLMDSLGYQFPRDAKDQVKSKYLKEVSLIDSLESDIVFFEENSIVTHVGILISKPKFSKNSSGYKFYIIHSSGTVKISELIIDRDMYAIIDDKSNEVKLHKIMRFYSNE